MIYMKYYFSLSFIVVLGLLGCLPNLTVAQEAKPDFDDQQLEFFESKVRPILVERCYECHGPDSAPIEGSLSLGSRKAILAGGDTGPGMVPKHPEKSLIIDAINYGEVYEMPPDTKMPPEEIKILTDWVRMGAPWPVDSDVEIEVGEEFDIEKRKSEHWCWQPIRRTSPPSVKNQAWSNNPIDQFVLSKLESEGLKPAKSADKRTLIRRLYFDVIGLPPSPKQVESFLQDSSSDAYEKVVDELLSSPHFGERWARHWMDMVRYAESGGHEFDYDIPYAFQYRDYLIRSFNQDVSYRQFIHEHIAGDLLKQPRRHKTEKYNESILGTGFWFLGEAKHGAVDSRLEEARTVDNQIDVMTKSFLGLTVACARCHDHKFDAISTEDYYALSGFLQSSRRQDAMLDPGLKIEKKFVQARQLQREGDVIVDELLENLKNSDPKSLSKYLDVALTLMREQKKKAKKALVIEGEDLKILSVSKGEALVQTIPPRDNFKWSGDKQLWWKHGKNKSELRLGFELPATYQPGEYSLSGVFTAAHDYGAAGVFVNKKLVKQSHDFYAADLSTIELRVGNVELTPGANELKIVLRKRNKAAAPSDMFGIDFVKLVPVRSVVDSEDEKFLEAVAENNLDRHRLKKVVELFSDRRLERSSHVLNPFIQALQFKEKVDSGFADALARKLDQEVNAHEKWLEQTTLFADFSDGTPEDWFETGYAFGRSNESSKFSAEGEAIEKHSVISSGRLGRKFRGVLRSPTFEIQDGFIYHRHKGADCNARLVINGFRMDEYSALLYKGCITRLKTSNDFVWQLQSQDIPNYIGQRAHFEIIDHGDGYVALDEIRFAKKKLKPVDAPSPLVQHLVNAGFNNQQEFCDQVAEFVCQTLDSQDSEQAVQLASEFFKHKLAGEFSSSKKVSTATSLSANHIAIKTVREPVSSLMADFDSVRRQLRKLSQDVPAPMFAHGMTDGNGEEEFVFIRGNHKALGQVATRRFLSALSSRTLNPENGSGRLLLAQKITAPNNPLTSRVAVNRVWHHMFGKGIVSSVDNFGVLGNKPTHPDLLDFLAAGFVKDGWSIKRLIKRIAMSKTYQMSSETNVEFAKVDPDNKWLHRARIKRLQGEAIRDSMLAVSGRLDNKMYGQPVPVHLTKFMSGRGRPKSSGAVDGDGRRSVYISVRRNFLSPMMLAFDTPIPFNAIGSRNQSNVPAQALILMNDPFVIGQAKHWAEQLTKIDDSVEERVVRVYESAIGRKPSKDEIDNASSFIDLQAQELNVAEKDVLKSVELWQDFCHVVFNLKEFIYIN
jgi:hypothetical protein